MPMVAKAVEFDTRSGRRSWTVVGPDGIPIDDLEAYLGAIRSSGRANNTVKSYARHLSLFWRWLNAAKVDWEELTFPDLTDFLHVYRRGVYPLERVDGRERTQSSTRAVAAAVKEFIDFQRTEGRGPTQLILTRASRYSARPSSAFLAHIQKRAPGTRNRLLEGFKDTAHRPGTIDFEIDFEKLLQACETFRDRLLLSAMYDGGIRVGQALGLRHGDLLIPEKHILVERRDNNLNGATSKTPDLLNLKMPRRFFDLYTNYLLRELLPRQIDSDYLFVNINQEPLGAPCSYSNIYQQVASIGSRAGFPSLTPHVLRHTHATYLAKEGWTSAQIAARLGQRHAASADVYIHITEDDIDQKLAETSHLIWNGSEERPDAE
ncbi:tyrosine-type recombinase/integrase [Cryobacterium lyxosi]|nr:tyrosine-type recombinase/integrase [Cryobacterium lyxosi]